jgi:hypothetical protein
MRVGFYSSDFGFRPSFGLRGFGLRILSPELLYRFDPFGYYFFSSDLRHLAGKFDFVT